MNADLRTHEFIINIVIPVIELKAENEARVLRVGVAGGERCLEQVRVVDRHEKLIIFHRTRAVRVRILVELIVRRSLCCDREAETGREH